MYERILVAIDFSQPSVEALQWAASRFPAAELILFHAIEPVDAPGYLQRTLGDRMDLLREQELDAKTNMEQLAEDVGSAARAMVRRGWAPRMLNRAALEAGAQLVIVGAHRKRIWPWDEPGATAESIVDRAEPPVLVWRPIQHQRSKTVLAAVDLRQESAPVAATAARYAAYFRTRLLLLHVLPGTLQAYLRAVSTPAKVDEAMGSVEQTARTEALERVPEDLRDDLEVQVVVARGRPVTQILAVAETEAVDLVVVGKSYAPGIAGRALLGSVTGRVIRGANCSVLSVPRGTVAPAAATAASAA